MNDREMLTTFIKEVIEENNGIYNWSWFSLWDDLDCEKMIENNPNLWREKVLRNHWMVNNPNWNVFIVGMYVLDDDGKVEFREDLKFLVAKRITPEKFMKDYQDKIESPIYVQWVHVLGDDGASYKNIEEPEEHFDCLNYDEEWEPDVPEDERDAAYYH
jgi:hypothetical protein